jgi:hypothetical protein
MKYFSELGKNVRFLVFEQSNLLMLRHRQDGRCPVALYKLYKCLRPADMCKDNDKFYIQTMPSMTKVEYGLKTSYGVEQNHFYHAKNDKSGRHRKR